MLKDGLDTAVQATSLVTQSLAAAPQSDAADSIEVLVQILRFLDGIYWWEEGGHIRFVHERNAKDQLRLLAGFAQTVRTDALRMAFPNGNAPYSTKMRQLYPHLGGDFKCREALSFILVQEVVVQEAVQQGGVGRKRGRERKLAE